MAKYSCLIVDDNEIERDAIEMHLRKMGSLEIKAVCSSGMEAAAFLMQNPVDLIFSDIDMPELNGTDLLKSLSNPPEFIFITSYSQYAAESFDLDALDFIVKPATFERLLKATAKAIEYLDLKKLAQNHASHVPEANGDHFFIKESKGFTRLNYNDVIYIESMGDFSKIYTATDKHITLVNLKNLERQLPQFFFRAHKQFLINLNHIATITSNEVLLSHDCSVPVSISNRLELIEKITANTLSRSVKN